MEASSSASEMPNKGDPTEEPGPSTAIECNRDPSKPVENIENANKDQKPSKSPRLPFSIFGHVPGFPHFMRHHNASFPAKTFASSLFASGHGYALFSAQTAVGHLPDDFKKIRGITIGDVGVLSHMNEFLFAFNIFLPADHPYNKNNTPDSFYPLDPLNESEICTTVDYFPRGSVIASKGIKVTRHSEDPLHLTFRSSERRGGFMVLPEGATRQEISRTTTRVFDYVRDNAVHWAHYFAQTRGQTTANGSTYFITGVDKTSVCSNLVFPSVPPTITMSATHQGQLTRAAERMSRVNNASNMRENRALSPIPKNLCIFLRGIRVGLGRTEWIENADERPEDDTPYSEIFFDAPRLTFFNIRVCGEDEQAVAQNDKSFFALHAFHPSDIVAQIMLCMVQDDATAALVDDSIWSIASLALSDRKSRVRQDTLTFNCLRGCSFDDFCSMLDDVFELHDLNENQGILRLVEISKPIAKKDPWHRRFWLWLTNREPIRGGTVFRELVRQGQFHFDTNDDVQFNSML